MGKRALLMKWLQDVRASYWFIPTVLAVLAVVLAQFMQYMDHHKFLLTDAWRTTQVEGARSTLALISQAVIGVTGVMFSMTIVAVSFASGNFGPRLIGNFMRDRGNQLSLGILIATFVYSLLILRAIQSPYGPDGAKEAFVPHLSMLVALGLTGVSILTMIYYVHHIPEIINVSNISADLGARLRKAVEARIDANLENDDGIYVDWPDTPAPCQIFLLNDGFLQTWDHQRLIKLASENELHLELRSAAGSFVTTFSPVLDVWYDEKISDELKKNIRDCFALGTVPTEQQNLLFIVEQLVEMIARALSPGVNDPYTAINCLNWLYVGLITAANYNGGLKAQPQARVRHSSLDLEKLFAASITEGLPYIKSDPMVCEHLDAMLNRLILETENPEAQLVAKRLRSEIASNLKSQ